MINPLGFSKIAVIGGTGSLGRVLTRSLADLGVEEIVVISRDELKQTQMARDFRDVDSVTFAIADVRDRHRMVRVMRGSEAVVNAAALKHVPQCEAFPTEAVQTNVAGFVNVVDAAVAAGVQKVVAISTDKAVEPVNVMGFTKATMERIALSMSGCGTSVSVVRYGNVMGSRGSVIPVFADAIRTGQPLAITDRLMTRFMISLADAADLIIQSLLAARSGEIWIRKSPSVRVGDLAAAVSTILTGSAAHPMVDVGTRPGEKVHETLLTAAESAAVVEKGRFSVVPFGVLDAVDQTGRQDAYSSAQSIEYDVERIVELLRGANIDCLSRIGIVGEGDLPSDPASSSLIL